MMRKWDIKNNLIPPPPPPEDEEEEEEDENCLFCPDTPKQRKE